MGDGSARTAAVRRRIRRKLDGVRARLGERTIRAIVTNTPIRDNSYEEAACALLEPDRLTLPEIELEDLFVEVPPVTLDLLPRGSWSSPVADMVAMARLVAAIRPRRVLEVGSFRGYTAAAMADHLPAEGELVAVDIDERHGGAYAGTPRAERIDRRVGTVREVLADEPAGSFDVVFVDADHRYDAVADDTDAVLPLVAADGWLVWHDYANWGLFSGGCGVPEFVQDFAATRPAVHLAGTALAVHRPSWADADADQLTRAIDQTAGRDPDELWAGGAARS